MPAINIHLEGIEAKDFKDGDVLHILKRIKDQRIPIALSLPPWMEDYWLKTNSKVLNYVADIVSVLGNVLGQQGNTHKCSYSHTLVDPWHENFCLYGRTPSKEEQRELMETGRQRLTALIGTVPTLYAPPNHLFNSNTLEVAFVMGYKFFATRAIIPLPPYEFEDFKDLAVIPERSLTQGGLGGSAAYIHYDEINSHQDYYDTATRSAFSMHSLKSEPVNPRMISLNNLLLRGWKYIRDIKKFPKKSKAIYSKL